MPAFVHPAEPESPDSAIATYRATKQLSTFTHAALLAFALALAFAVAVAPSQAVAANVSSQSRTIHLEKGGGEEIRYSTAFAADPGEANRLTIRILNGAAVFSEATLPVRAGSLCTQRSPGSASCPNGDMAVALGDGDDHVDADLFVPIDGGPGNDVLIGGGARLSGGPGTDTVIGKSDPDFKTPGFPSLITNQFMDPGPAEHDVYRGATGNDSVSYEGRKTAVRVTLGSDNNEDELSSIRTIFGSDAGDVLIGNAGANTLVGGKGRDRLTGGSGNDVLEGNNDGDRLAGGKGNDQLVVAGNRDHVRCGPGADRLVEGDDFKRPVNVPADCETARTGDFDVAGAPRRRGRFVYLRLRHIELKDFSRVLLFAGGRLVGRSRSVNRQGTYRVKLTKTGRRLARRGRTIVVSNGHGPSKGPEEQPYRFRLR